MKLADALQFFIYKREHPVSPTATKRWRHSHETIRSLKARADARRSLLEKLADIFTTKFGSISFLGLNVAWFTVWIVMNTGLTSIPPFDPFPFGLLTMIVSLEAIVLAIVVLISQNRSSRVDDLREETDLEVNIIAEQELTKLLHLVAQIAEKNGIDPSKDKLLQEMLKPVDTEKIERVMEEQVNAS